MIAHVLWDWNGTLLDDTAACVEALNGILLPRGMRKVTVQSYRRQFGFPVHDYYVRLGFDFTRDGWENLAHEFHELYRESVKNSSLGCGVVETLERLTKMGMPMSILSASETSLLEKVMGDFGVVHFFRGIYGLPDLFAHSKLDVGREALRHIGGSSGDVLLVGDTIHDHEVARALSCQCVLVCGGHQARIRLKECGRVILDDVSQVSEYVARSRGGIE